MVVGFTTTCTYAFSAYHHYRGLLDTTLCDKVCDRSVVFSGTLVSSTIKIDRQDITEILLKVALNTISP
jgi:hypothetical protein